jgi:hypothetical protein
MISETKLRRAIRAALLREATHDYDVSQHSVGGRFGEIPRPSKREPLVANPIAAIEKLFSNLDLFPAFSTTIKTASTNELLLLIKLVLGYSPSETSAFDEEAKNMIAERQTSLKASNRK